MGCEWQKPERGGACKMSLGSLNELPLTYAVSPFLKVWDPGVQKKPNPTGAQSLPLESRPTPSASCTVTWRLLRSPLTCPEIKPKNLEEPDWKQEWSPSSESEDWDQEKGRLWDLGVEVTCSEFGNAYLVPKFGDWIPAGLLLEHELALIIVSPWHSIFFLVCMVMLKIMKWRKLYSMPVWSCQNETQSYVQR